MISYFLRTSVSDSATIFSRYVVGLRTTIKTITSGKKYSKDVEVLLMEYIYEGEFTKLPEKEIRFISYRSKEQMAIVTVGVGAEFGEYSDEEKKATIIRLTKTSLDIFEKSLSKKKLDVSGFPQLRTDLEICYDEYRKMILMTEME